MYLKELITQLLGEPSDVLTGTLLGAGRNFLT